MERTTSNSDCPYLPRPFLIRVLGFVVILVGCGAILGWVTGNEILASYSPDFVPMAPVTAVLFLLYGAYFLTYRLVPKSLAAIAVALAITTATVLLIFRLLPVYFDLEYLSLLQKQSLDGIPLGFMSGVSAFCFLLVGVATSALLARTLQRKQRRYLVYGSTIILLSITFVFFLGYLYGEPILYGGTNVPPALSTILAFAVIGVGVLLCGSVEDIGSRSDDSAGSAYPMMTVFVILMLAIISVGGLYFRNYEQQYRKEVGKSLESISNLKVNHISYWLSERVSDGKVLFRNKELSKQVADYISSSVAERSTHPLQSWLNTYYAYGEIRAALVDLEGKTILSQYPDNADVSKEVALDVRQIAAADSVSLHDFYRDEHDGRVYLAVMVPIKDSVPSEDPIAVLILRVDPQYFLFPFVQQWPTESNSGETLIIRRDEDDVLFLNELRFRKNASMNFRIPVSRTDLPAAMAVTGTTGIVEGKDYRDVEVIAYVEKVPHSSWFLVARIDKEEVFAALRERLFILVSFVLILALGAGGWFTMLVRRQRLQYYKDKSETADALRESEFRLRQAESVGHLGHWQYDMRSMILQWSDEMYRIHGVTPQSFHPSPDRLLLLIHPDDRQLYREAVARIPESGSETFEYRIIMSDGSTRHVMVRGLTGIRDNATTDVIYGITLDTTEIKTRERQLEDINAELARFTYTVSHDLKSPLVTIQTFLGYLEQDSAAGNQENVDKDMEYIKSAINKMSQLLGELLEMSRVGRISNPPEHVLCREIVEEALAIVAGHIHEKKINIRVSNIDIPLFVDRPRLVEVWQNLIDNAVKYMGDTTDPSIEIGSLDKNSQKVFYVKDNGIGIEPRYKDKVFGLFEKLHTGTEGTGIGLALVKRIVNLHEGNIWFESDGIGKGTCFYFTVPTAMTHQGDVPA